MLGGSKLPSKNNEALKHFLENDWKIKEIKISIDNIRKEQTSTVIIEKAKKKKTITVVNDPVFMEYILHFKAFPDGYGNSQFIYVEDLKKYNRELAQIKQKGIVPKRPYQILVGKRKIKAPHLYHLIFPGPKAHVGAAHFFVDLKKNPTFCDFDFRDEIEIFFTDNGQKVFGGYAHSVSYNASSAVFLCLGGDRRLHEGRMATEFVVDSQNEGADALYFIAESAGFTSKFHGKSGPNLRSRKFKVIFPVHGLEIPGDFNVENVLFTPNLQKELSNKAKKGKTLSNHPWSSAKAFGVVVIGARHFFEALVNAEPLVQRAVDWIQLRTDLTIPCISIGRKKKKIYYNLRKNFSKCQLMRYGLIVDQNTGSAIFHLLGVRAGHKLVIKYDPEEYMEPIVPIYKKITSKTNFKEKEIRRIHQALNWMMFSFENESPVHNLLQLWISCEFICSDEKVPRIVDRKYIKKATNAVKKVNVPKQEEEHLIKSICEVNDPPLMSKWYHLLSRLKIKLIKEELDLIAKLRTARNKIMHGEKGIKLSIQEIEKFRSILERVLLLKIDEI